MNSLYNKLLSIFFICILILSCEKEEETNFTFPLAEENGINAKALEQAFTKGKNINGLGALIVERNNTIIGSAEN